MGVDEYDLFVSYRWVDPDKSWVRHELVPRLRSAGLRVCLDVDDFVPGRDLILEMDRAGLRASRVLAVVSPDYFEGNRMVHFESLSARRRDPSGERSTLIPLVLRACEQPNWMRGLVPVDFTRPGDAEREWSKLLHSVGASKLDVSPPPVLGSAPQRTRKVTAAALDLVDLFPLSARNGQGFGWDFVVSNQSVRQYEIDRARIHGEAQIPIAGLGTQHSRWEYEVSLMTKLTADDARLELHGSVYDDPESEWGRNCSGSLVHEFSTSRGRILWKYDLTLPIAAAFLPARTTTVRLAFKPHELLLRKESERGEVQAFTSGPVVKAKHTVSFIRRRSVVLRAATDGHFLNFVRSLSDACLS